MMDPAAEPDSPAFLLLEELAPWLLWFFLKFIGDLKLPKWCLPFELF